MYFRPSEYYKPNDEYYLKRFFADRTIQGRRDEFSKEYLNYSEDYLLLPLWTEERPSQLPQEKISSSDVNVYDFSELGSTNFTAMVNSEMGGVVSAAIYYYPGWKVEIDGISSEIKIEKVYSTCKAGPLRQSTKTGNLIFIFTEQSIRQFHEAG